MKVSIVLLLALACVVALTSAQYGGYPAQAGGFGNGGSE